MADINRVDVVNKDGVTVLYVTLVGKFTSFRIDYGDGCYDIVSGKHFKPGTLVCEHRYRKGVYSARLRLVYELLTPRGKESKTETRNLEVRCGQ